MSRPSAFANSGKQDGRDFNNRDGERGRQPISFRSCAEDSENTGQKSRTSSERAARTVVRSEDYTHGDQAEGGHKQSNVDQTQIPVVHSQDDPASQRRKEAGKLQEDRSKAVIAKAIAEATKAVEKTSVRKLKVFPAEVREGNDSTLSSRMNTAIEQFEKSTEAILSTPQSESEHVTRHHAKAQVKAMTRMRPRSPRPVTNRRNIS